MPGIGAPAVGTAAPSAISPFPGDETGDSLHVPEHAILLNIAGMRNTIINTAGVITVEGLLYIDEASLINLCSATTTVIDKMRIKTLKKWAENNSDIGTELDIQDFTAAVCRKL